VGLFGRGGRSTLYLNRRREHLDLDKLTAEFWSFVVSSADGNKRMAISNLGGIWSAQTTPQTVLNLTPVNGALLFSWPVSSADFVLQQSQDLTTASWVTLTNLPVLNYSNLLDQVVVTPEGASGIYRLATP
jgi:hypothetical protein